MFHLTGSPFGDMLVAPQSDDTLEGLAGADTLIGDLFNGGAGHPDILMECIAGGGEVEGPGGGASGVIDLGQNDRLEDGSGFDLVVGDAMAAEYSELVLNALSGTGGRLGGPGGDLNSGTCYNDLWLSGAGNDRWAGDVYHVNGLENAELNAAAGSAAMGWYSFFPQGPGGDGGDGNGVAAFNDRMSDEMGNPGDDIMVGDVWGLGGRGHAINAFAGTGAQQAGAGGDGNVAEAYNDLLLGDAGNDRIVGDAFAQNTIDDTILRAHAGTGGDNGGGAGGDFNLVSAFQDQIFGGANVDVIVGDIWQIAGSGAEIQLSVLAGTAGVGGGAGGTGNTVFAFNDQIDGGAASDTLVGDVRRAAGQEDIHITISGDATSNIAAFQDVLDGGAGSDLLIGDFLGEAPGDPPTIQIVGSFSGRAQLFGDRINGGQNGDTLIGGLGADQLTGGGGFDRFVWQPGDLYDVMAGAPVGTPPVDQITDFAKGGVDLIDVRPLLADLGFGPGDDIRDWLLYTPSGVHGVISIDQDGPVGGQQFLPFIFINNFGSGGSILTMQSNGEIVFI